MSKEKDKKATTLNWEEFRLLGDPNHIVPEDQSKNTVEPEEYTDRIRIHLDKKSRGGKTVTLIKGLTCSDSRMSEYSKALKLACGVGGTAKNQIIILQGDQRNKVLEYFNKKGFRDVKFSGG